jgi:hypothetical protein
MALPLLFPATGVVDNDGLTLRLPLDYQQERYRPLCKLLQIPQELLSKVVHDLALWDK